MDEKDINEETSEITVKKRRRRSPKEIFSKPSPLRIINMIVSFAVFVWLWVMFFLTVADVIADPYNRLLSYAMVSLLMIAPYLIELVFGFKWSDFVLTFIIIYALLAGVVGAALAGYGRIPYYDKVVHGVFGYVGSLVGLYITCRFYDLSTLNKVFVAIVCFAVSMGLGAVWEILEFSSDTFLGQTSQGGFVETVTGEWVTPVTDTMLDIICNFAGAVVFLIHFIIHSVSKKNLLLGSIIKDFSIKH